eukprot:1903805-Prymnesium_polylepis.1
MCGPARRSGSIPGNTNDRVQHGCPCGSSHSDSHGCSRWYETHGDHRVGGGQAAPQDPAQPT